MTAKGASKSNPTKVRKRVEALESSASLKRAKDGSAFAKCEECNKSIPAGLIDMHSCSLEAKIKMTLETQVVEITETKKKPAEKKIVKATKGEAKPSKKVKNKKVKKQKDPNMPKRPPTAFFIFMDEFRKTYKEVNPDNKSVSDVAKKGGEEWKSKTDEEKKQYVDKAKELKAEYEKAMANFNASKQEDGTGSDKEDDDAEIAEELQDDSD